MSYRISVLGPKCRLVRNLVPEWCFRSKWAGYRGSDSASTGQRNRRTIQWLLQRNRTFLLG